MGLPQSGDDKKSKCLHLSAWGVVTRLEALEGKASCKHPTKPPLVDRSLPCLRSGGAHWLQDTTGVPETGLSCTAFLPPTPQGSTQRLICLSPRGHQLGSSNPHRDLDRALAVHVSWRVLSSLPGGECVSHFPGSSAPWCSSVVSGFGACVPPSL